MKKFLFWRICYLLKYKLGFDDGLGAVQGYDGTVWPSTSRMKQIWEAHPWNVTAEFPLKLYRRLRKSRQDISIIGVYHPRLANTDPPYRASGAVATDVAYGIAAATEDKFEIRWWNSANNAYVVGVRNEVANLWR